MNAEEIRLYHESVMQSLDEILKLPKMAPTIKQPEIQDIFRRCLQITTSKRHDYASIDDNHENFKRSAELASWFSSKEDKPYIVLIATKLARLATLLDNKTPNHESIEDSFLDLINYCGLWAERRLQK